MDDGVARAWDRLCDKIERAGYESLTPREAAWVTVRTLIDDTRNGGLISYFYGSGADNLDECRAALRMLRAPAVVACLDYVAALFAPESLATVESRHEEIDSWNDDDEQIDEMLAQLDDKLDELFEDLEEKLDAFVRADERDGPDE